MATQPEVGHRFYAGEVATVRGMLVILLLVVPIFNLGHSPQSIRVAGRSLEFQAQVIGGAVGREFSLAVTIHKRRVINVVDDIIQVTVAVQIGIGSPI